MLCHTHVSMCDVCFLLHCLLRSSWWSAFLPGLSSLLPSDNSGFPVCVFMEFIRSLSTKIYLHDLKMYVGVPVRDKQ